MTFGTATVALGLGTLLLATAPASLVAQRTGCTPPAPPDQEWVPLCANGNGLDALRRVVEVPAWTMTLAEALHEIARRGSVDITLDATLPLLRDSVSLTGGRRPVAAALLQIVERRGLEIAVGVGNQLIVAAAPPAARADEGAIRGDSLQRAAMLARVIVTARRDSTRAAGEPRALGRQTYDARELAKAPGFFGNDLLRTARLLPGMTARNDFSTALNVRGGESDQTLVMLDGIPVYSPFHLGGVLSTFIEPAVSQLDVINGVFPSRYNGRLSGLLDVRSASEPRTGVHGSADVNLLWSVASLGGTTRRSGTSWLIAGRRTYADAAAKLVGEKLPYHFQDANLHITQPLRGGSRLELSAYTGADVANYRERGDTLQLDAGNTAAGLSWSATHRRPSSLLGLFTADSVGVVQRVSLTTFDADLFANNVDVEIGSRVHDGRISGSLTAFTASGSHALGYELARQRMDYALLFPVAPYRAVAPTGRHDGSLLSFGGWYERRWQVTPSLLVDGGGRADVVRGLGTLFSPRASATLRLTPALALTAAVGRHAQWMHSALREEIPARLIDFWIPSDSTLPPARAWVYSLGVERSLGPARKLRLEGFHKQLGGVVVRNTLDDALVAGDELARESGRSSGVELLLRQAEHNGFSGWLSYSFAISRRTGADGVSYAPAQDRRHELNAVASWRTRRYLLGARFGLASGTPYTIVRGEYDRQRYDPVRDEWGEELPDHSGGLLFGARNGARFPVAHRLDLGLTRMGPNGTARTMPYLSIANVYGAFNPAVYVFDFGRGERIGAANFRFLPTFGIRHVF